MPTSPRTPFRSFTAKWFQKSRSETGAAGNLVGIQVLRAVAALMVVMHHAKSSVPGSDAWPSFGAAGVDIFFVISGFVMAHSLRHDGSGVAGHRRWLAGNFLLRRVVRVVPMYWIAVLWTSRRELAGGAVSADLLKDLVFIPHPNSEYPQMLWPTLIQGWTLNYEMYFYVLFAAAILVSRHHVQTIIATLVVITALPLVLGALAPALLFYTHNIVLEFAAGIALQRAVARYGYPQWPRAAYLVLMVAGFCLLGWGYDASPRAAFQGLPSALIVWSAIPLFSGWRVPAWEETGNASYAIYLFHWTSFGLLRPAATWLHGWEKHGLSAPATAFVMMVLHLLVALAAGLLIHRWLERPLLRGVESWFGLRRTKAAQ